MKLPLQLSLILNVLFAGRPTKDLLAPYRGLTPDDQSTPREIAFVSLVLARAIQQAWTDDQLDRHGPTRATRALLLTSQNLSAAVTALAAGEILMPGHWPSFAEAQRMAAALPKAKPTTPAQRPAAALQTPVVAPTPTVSRIGYRFPCLLSDQENGKAFSRIATVISETPGKRKGSSGKAMLRIGRPDGELSADLEVSGRQLTRLLSTEGGNSGTDVPGLRILTNQQAEQFTAARRTAKQDATPAAPIALLPKPRRSSLDLFRALAHA